MPVVNIPDIGSVKFPDDMPHDEIINAIESDIIPSYEAHLEKTGISSAAVGAFKKGMAAANEGIAQPLESMGFPGLAENRRQAAEEYRAEGEQAYEPTTEEEVAAAQNLGTIPGALKWAKKNIAEPIGEIGGRYGPPTVAAGMAGMMAPEAGAAAGLAKAAGFISTDIAPEMGENIERAKEAGSEEPSLLANVSGGLVEATIGHYGLPLTGKLASTLFTRAEELAPKIVSGELSKEAAIKELGGFGVNIAKEVGSNAAANAAAMTGIEATRRAVAGQEVTSPEAQEQYLEGAKTAATLAPIFGTAHGVMNVRGAREALPEGRVEEVEEPTSPETQAAEQMQGTETKAAETEQTPPAPPEDYGDINEDRLADFITQVQEGLIDVHDPANEGLIKAVEAQHPETMSFLGLKSKFTDEDLAKPADKHAVDEEEEVAPTTETEAKETEPTEEPTAEPVQPKESPNVHADPLVNDLFNPANRTTKVEKEPTFRESVSKVIKRYTPTRISWIDPTDTLGAKLKPEDTYSVADKVLRADILQRQLKQLGQVIRGVEELGRPVFKGDGTVGVKSDDRLALGSIHNRAVELGKKHGFDGPQFIDELARVMLGKETIKEDANLHAYGKHLQSLAEKHKQNAKTLSKQGGATATEINREFNAAKQFDKKAKEYLAINRERVVSPEHIGRVEALMKKYPESKQIIGELRDLNRSLVDLVKTSGLIDAHTAKKWNDKEHYIPMYKPEDLDSFENEQSRWGVGMGAKTIKNAADYRREGHEHKINVWDNVQRHVALMVASAAQNESRRTAVHQLAKYGEVEKAQDQGRTSKDGNLAVYENGVKTWYVVKDPDALIAFQNFNYAAKPLMQMAGRVLRTGALFNPIYWYRQLVRDPLAANFVANVGGVITPLHAMAHFAHILTGKSKDFKTLREHGVVGPVDLTHNYNMMQNHIGKAMSYDRDIWSKIKNQLVRIHEASDSATRVAVYREAMKDAKKMGLSGQDAENYAVHRARESINFAVHGTSETLHAIRVSTPFFSSTLNGLDTVYRAARGHNLSPKESRQIKRRFISRALMMSMMSAIYAITMQGNKDYQKLDPVEADGNWLVAGTPNENGDTPFYKIPAPFEVGFLFKTLPELFVRYMYSNATNKEIIDSVKKGMASNILPPIPLVGQALKPALETMMNYDIHNMRQIESAHDQTLNVEMRGQGDNAFYDWLSDDLKLKNINLSPKKLRHLWQGYFAQLGAISASLADSLITSATGENKTPVNPESGFLKGIKTDPTKSKYLSEFYELSGDASKIVNALNSYESTAQGKKIEELVSKPENVKLLGVHDMTSKAQQDISEIRTAINTLKHQPDTPENRKSIRDLKMAENQIAESVMKAQ